jgi:hypothetical protein
MVAPSEAMLCVTCFCVVAPQVATRVRQGRLQNLFTLPARYPPLQVCLHGVYAAMCAGSLPVASA